MSNDNYDAIEEAEKKATGPYDKILAEYEKLSETLHDVRRNVNFIISDMLKTAEDTPENHSIESILENANSVVTNNSNFRDMVNMIHAMGYNAKVKARMEARMKISVDRYHASEVGKNAREFMEKTKTE